MWSEALYEPLYDDPTSYEERFWFAIFVIDVILVTLLPLSFALGGILGLIEAASPLFNKINRPLWNAAIAGIETTLVKWIFFYFSYNTLFGEAKSLRQNDLDTNITLITALGLIGMTFGVISGIGEYRSFFMPNDEGKSLVSRLRGKNISQWLKELGKTGLALLSGGWS